MSQIQKPNGFTLIEIAIVLMIVGIVTTAVFKGQDLIESAKTRATISEFQKIKIAFMSYQETYGQLPGDDSKARERFGDAVSNGNGDRLISGADIPLVWIHLQKAGSISSAQAPTTKLGGEINLISQPEASMPGHWLQLSGINGAGLLTPKQAQTLKSRLDEEGTKPTDGSLRVAEASGSAGVTCLKGDGLNLEINQPVCRVYFQL